MSCEIPYERWWANYNGSAEDYEKCIILFFFIFGKKNP